MKYMIFLWRGVKFSILYRLEDRKIFLEGKIFSIGDNYLTPLRKAELPYQYKIAASYPNSMMGQAGENHPGTVWTS